MDRWGQFNAIIDDESLDLKEKGLLLILFRFINYEKGYADPSRALIKKLYGTNKNDVLDKVMNSLIEKGYLVRESGRGKRSKYYVKLGTQIEPSAKVEPSTKIESILGTQTEPILGTQIEPQKENKKKIKENIYNNIFYFWINKDIRNHRSLSRNIKSAIDKTLKEYNEGQIIEAINNYGDMLKSDYPYCDYRWGLDEFLLRTDKDRTRQLPKFLNDGSKYINYLKWLNGNKDNPKPIFNSSYD